PGHLGQGAPNGRLEAGRYVGAYRAETRNRINSVPRHDRSRVRPREGRLAPQHLVEHTAEGVEIGPVIELFVACRLLRAHVGRGPEREAGLGQAVLADGTQGSGDTEIRHEGMPSR